MKQIPGYEYTYESSDISELRLSLSKLKVSVKFNLSMYVFVSGHMVIAGNGICHTGVDFSAKLTITGD